MPHLLMANRSDPLSPEAEHLWSSVARLLADHGWSWGPTEAGAAHWNDPWTLTADPTGGARCLSGLPTFVEALPGSAPAETACRRAWWSMSDNSLVLNTLLDRGLCRVLHGHPLTLAGRAGPEQKARFLLWSAALRNGAAFPPEAVPPVVPLRGPWPNRGALVGGNLGAQERLGTTPWRPRPQGRILLVESLSATAEEAPTRLQALVSDPWWQGIAGLLVGRFTAADKTRPAWIAEALSRLPPSLPVARWPLVGHGADAWTVPLGEELVFSPS